MLHLKLLRYSALALVMFGVRPAKVDAGGLVELASLEGQLREHMNFIKLQPRDNSGYLAASQETSGRLEAGLKLVVDILLKFGEDPEIYYQVLKLLNFGPRFRRQRICTVKDYAHLDQEFPFFYCLGNLYSLALGTINKLLMLWWEDKLGLPKALARFLGASVEALRINCKVSLYCSGIFCENLGLCQDDQDDKDAAGSDREAAALIAERIEGAKRTICVNYEAAAERATCLFGRMVEELEDILSGLGDLKRRAVYGTFMQYLSQCFESWEEFSPERIGKMDNVCMDNNQRTLSEVQASVWVGIFKKLLKLKLRFPDLDHELGPRSKFFPRCFEFAKPHFDRPFLVSEDHIKMLKRRGCINEPSNLEKGSADRLSRKLEACGLRDWVCSLYWRSKRDNPVLREQAKIWLNDVERNTCRILEAIELTDKRAGLYALGCLMADLNVITVMIERILKIFYGTGNLGRGEGEPGHLLVKLSEVIGKAVGKGPCVKSARMTQGPEGAHGEESLQEEGSPTVPEPDQSEGDGAGSAAGSILHDGCDAGSGIGGEGENVCEALANAFVQSMELEPATAIEYNMMDEID